MKDSTINYRSDPHSMFEHIKNKANFGELAVLAIFFVSLNAGSFCFVFNVPHWSVRIIVF